MEEKKERRSHLGSWLQGASEKETARGEGDRQMVKRSSKDKNLSNREGKVFERPEPGRLVMSPHPKQEGTEERKRLSRELMVEESQLLRS